MTEYRRSHGAVNKREVAATVKSLATHLDRKAESLLPEGQSLAVRLNDIDLAGEYEPWSGSRYDHVRIVRSMYPPSIDLTFTLRDAQGNVLREGTSKLRDPAFDLGSSPAGDDALRYEKRMIDQWLRREFTSDTTAQSD